MNANELKRIEFNDHTMIFGIDLGTTNSAISLRTKSTVPSLVPLGTKNTLPSCVMWKDNRFIVGEEAYEQRYKSNVVYSVKRIMGTDNLITLVDGDETITLTPAEVSAEILKELCRRAEVYYPKITDVVITVPAYFNQKQIEDTVQAGKLAGLNVRHILKEPTGAGYIYSKIDSAESGEMLIYDLGGGTFDVTHLMLVQKSEQTKSVIHNLETLYNIDLKSRESSDDSENYYSRVLGVYGNSFLGGDDIDDTMVQQFLQMNNIKPEECSIEEIEKLKLSLEGFKKSDFSGMQITFNGKRYTVQRDLVIDATNKIYDKTREIMKPLMTPSNHRNVKSIILVGGSTKSPVIRNRLKEDFPSASIVCALNPDETVAMGAAAVGYDISGNETFKFQDVLPMAIGVLVNEKEISICMPANTTIPYVTEKVYTTMYDWQDCLEIQVYQGVSNDPEQCTYLGTIKVDDLPKKKRGEVDIVIKFILNIDGRLKVQAVVEDITKEIEIENIFSAGNKKEKDEFKELFYQKALAENNKEVLELFKERDAIPEDNRAEIEGRILESFL